MIEKDLRLDDGRTLHVYDTGGDGLPVCWMHGTPNIGLPPEPLFRDDLRWVSYDRPGYGGSTRHPGRSVVSVAADTAAVADFLGLDRLALVGHSGGATFALGTASLLGSRISSVLAVSALAPFGARGLDWFAGMIPSGVASLKAAAAGREAKEQHEASGAEYDPEFTEADLAALRGEWSFFEKVVGPAMEHGPGGLIDDDLCYVQPWIYNPISPVMLLHGGQDGIAPPAHADWLAHHLSVTELLLYPAEGHISILTHASEALDFLE